MYDWMPYGPFYTHKPGTGRAEAAAYCAACGELNRGRAKQGGGRGRVSYHSLPLALAGRVDRIDQQYEERKDGQTRRRY